MKLSKERLLGCNAQYVRFPFEDFAKTQRKLGISKLELSGTVPHIWCDHLSAARICGISDILKKEELSVTAFAPRAYRYSLCAGRESVQGRATADYYRNCLLAARELGAGLMIVTADGGCFDQDRDMLMENCRHALVELVTEGARFGVSVAVSPVAEEETPILTGLADISAMVASVGSLGAVFDLHLASIRGETLSDWFGALGDTIRLVRFSDGNYHGARIWGEGCLPCGRLLSELDGVGYNGAISLRIAGEGYVDDPAGADNRNLLTLIRNMR